MKDLTKSLVLKRDKGCILCNSRSLRREKGHDGTGNIGMKDVSPSSIHPVENAAIPTERSTPEPNGLHIHHEYGVYGNKHAHVPLQNWPWRNFKQQMVVLCDSHHARRTQGNHYSEIRDIRRYLLDLYPDYFSQFDVLGGT